MLLVIFFGVVISFVLIAVLRGSAPNVPYQKSSVGSSHTLGIRPEHSASENCPPRTEAEERHLQAVRSMTGPQLEAFLQHLAKHCGLTWIGMDDSGKREFYGLARFEHPLLRGNVAFCGHVAGPEEAVGSDVIISFSDMVKAERAMKGIFVTNGYFSEEVMKLNEGASMELIDAAQLARWIREISPDLLSPGLRIT